MRNKSTIIVVGLAAVVAFTLGFMSSYWLDTHRKVSVVNIHNSSGEDIRRFVAQQPNGRKVEINNFKKGDYVAKFIDPFDPKKPWTYTVVFPNNQTVTSHSGSVGTSYVPFAAIEIRGDGKVFTQYVEGTGTERVGPRGKVELEVSW